MISKEATQKFLNRQLDDFEWVKDLSPTRINQVLEDVIPSHLSEGLWLHQKMMLLIMQHQPRFMLFSGMGSGKTRTVLTHLQVRKLRGEKPKAIVFVPYLTAVDTWIGEVDKFAPELVYCPLLGSSVENLNTIRTTDADLFPICYQTAVAMFTESVKVQVRVKGEFVTKTKWHFNPDLVDEVISNFDTLVCDEIHRCKDFKSQTFLLCSYISQKVEWAYGMTGTPFGEDLQSLWPEFYIIDFGHTLGSTISFYREIFFRKKSGFWGGFKYEFKKKLKNRLRTIIRNKSIHFETNELVDIPDKQYIPIRIHPHGSVKGHIDKALAELKAAVIDKDYQVVGSSFLTLRQISSGFVTFKSEDEESKERLKIKFDHNPKLDALCGLIEDIPDDTKMVVFHEYIFSNEMISERLTKMKVGHARIWGGQKDPLGQLKKFREDKNCKVLVINSKSGSSALNLQNASIIVFYECPPVIDRAQAEARCWRPGQTKRVQIYDFLVKNTLDEEYYDAVRQGGDLLKQFLTGKWRQNGKAGSTTKYTGRTAPRT